MSKWKIQCRHKSLGLCNQRITSIARSFVQRIRKIQERYRTPLRALILAALMLAGAVPASAMSLRIPIDKPAENIPRIAEYEAFIRSHLGEIDRSAMRYLSWENPNGEVYVFRIAHHKLCDGELCPTVILRPKPEGFIHAILFAGPTLEAIPGGIREVAGKEVFPFWLTSESISYRVLDPPTAFIVRAYP